MQFLLALSKWKNSPIPQIKEDKMKNSNHDNIEVLSSEGEGSRKFSSKSNGKQRKTTYNIVSTLARKKKRKKL